MSVLLKVGFLVTLAIGLWFYLHSGPHRPVTIPQLDSEEWWGPSKMKGRQDTSIRSFKIKFESTMIADLKYRLKHHRQFPAPLEGVAFEYGFNTAQIDGWLNYWADEYNFSEREDFLNQFPQFKTNIQGLDIHYIHVKPQVPKDVRIVPLLMVHGWPGSVREFYEAIPLLTQPRRGYNFVFEMIIPSIPGYGFSDAAARPGLAVPQVAVVFKNLMSRLGHQKFYVQGGSWGAVIVAVMSTLYPDDILGHHSNTLISSHPSSLKEMLLGNWFPSLVVDESLADRIYPLSNLFYDIMAESGYDHIHGTKPETVGVSLTDSPAGLLAYILEKFSTWTNSANKFKDDGGLDLKFSKDQLIDNLMIYWTSNSITTSIRFYAENWTAGTGLKLHEIPTAVPTWGIYAKNELFEPPSLLSWRFPNLLNTTVLTDGGHFLAFELPDVLVSDVFKAVKAFKEFHKKTSKSEL